VFVARLLFLGYIDFLNREMPSFLFLVEERLQQLTGLIWSVLLGGEERGLMVTREVDSGGG
jgi:hypothetical protein